MESSRIESWARASTAESLAKNSALVRRQTCAMHYTMSAKGQWRTKSRHVLYCLFVTFANGTNRAASFGYFLANFRAGEPAIRRATSTLVTGLPALEREPILQEAKTLCRNSTSPYFAFAFFQSAIRCSSGRNR